MIALGRSGRAAGPFLRGPGIAAAFVARQLEIFSATPSGMGSHEYSKGYSLLTLLLKLSIVPSRH
jgi:hypothetical protein